MRAQWSLRGEESPLAAINTRISEAEREPPAPPRRPRSPRPERRCAFANSGLEPGPCSGSRNLPKHRILPGRHLCRSAQLCCKRVHPDSIAVFLYVENHTTTRLNLAAFRPACRSASRAKAFIAAIMPTAGAAAPADIDAEADGGEAHP